MDSDDTFIPLDADRIARLRKTIEKMYAPSRERSLALTKLEECSMWLERAPRSEPIVEGT